MCKLPAFASNSVQVLYAQLDLNPANALPDHAELSSLERERFTKIKHHGDRLRFITGRLIVRNMLAQSLNTSVQNIILDDDKGKPVLSTKFAQKSNIRFNISHSHELVMVALNAHADIGVDVEKVRALNHLTAMAKRIMSETEYAKYSTLKGALQPEAFFRLWTKKEALLKYWGTGFRKAPNSFHVGISDQTNLQGCNPVNNDTLTGGKLIVNGNIYFWHVASKYSEMDVNLIKIN